MEKLDVLYTTNHDYKDIMMGSILSLIINGNIQNINLHIVTSEFVLEDYLDIEKTLSQYSSVNVYFYDVKKINIEKYNMPSWRGTQIANARLFYQDILNDKISSIDNLLYLDSDTIVVSNLDGLFEYMNNTVNAVLENPTQKRLEGLELTRYFNSGVLLFNTEMWCQNNYQERIIHFLENNNKPLIYPDQDTLNMAINKGISELPINYNLSTGYFLYDRLLRLYLNSDNNEWIDELIEGKKDPKIIHSTGIWGIKAWTNNNINPYNDEFIKYILLGNPEFIKPEISDIKRLLTQYPALFKTILLIKSRLPEPAQKLVRKITSK